jgi:hypothetical protein
VCDPDSSKCLIPLGSSCANGVIGSIGDVDGTLVRDPNQTGSNRFGSRTTALPANRLTRTTGGTRTGSWFDPAVQGRTVVRKKKWSWAGGVGSVYWPQNFIFFPMGEQKNDRWLQRLESENNGEIP